MPQLPLAPRRVGGSRADGLRETPRQLIQFVRRQQRAAAIGREAAEHLGVQARIGQLAIGAADEHPVVDAAETLVAAADFGFDAEQAAVIGAEARGMTAGDGRIGDRLQIAAAPSSRPCASTR